MAAVRRRRDGVGRWPVDLKNTDHQQTRAGSETAADDRGGDSRMRIATARDKGTPALPADVASIGDPGGSEPGDIATLYAAAVAHPVAQLPRPGTLDHTMAHDLDAYVEQRVAVDLLDYAVTVNAHVEVRGIYPSHIQCAATHLHCRELVATTRRARSKPTNWVRPEYWWARDTYDRLMLLALVPPGRDYLLHYASMVRHALSRRSSAGDELLAVWRYPRAERLLARWTGLTEVLGSADVVVLGNVDAQDVTAMLPDRMRLWALRNPYYAAQYARLGDGRVVTFLAVHYSYWGSTGAALARHACDVGAGEVIYVGKLGALTSPADLYARLFVPSRFAVMDRLDYQPCPPAPNRVLDTLPTLDTGLHVSVPTVLEENCVQREVAGNLGASSIDNEMAHMAAAVAAWNWEHGGDVAFSGLHYATDYLRRPGELRHATPYSLVNGRTDEARKRRRTALDMISHGLARHLAARGRDDRHRPAAAAA